MINNSKQLKILKAKKETLKNKKSDSLSRIKKFSL